MPSIDEKQRRWLMICKCGAKVKARGGRWRGVGSVKIRGICDTNAVLWRKRHTI
jgi:hypothetical protein